MFTIIVAQIAIPKPMSVILCLHIILLLLSKDRDEFDHQSGRFWTC